MAQSIDRRLARIEGRRGLPVVDLPDEQATDKFAGYLKRAGLWTPTIAAELAEGWGPSLNELRRELRKGLAHVPKH